MEQGGAVEQWIEDFVHGGGMETEEELLFPMYSSLPVRLSG
jgi:hypothetical protein